MTNNPKLTERLEHLEERLDRAEACVALLLAERFGNPMTAHTALRRVVRQDMGRLFKEADERVLRQLRTRTPIMQFTGGNLTAVREFAGDVASIVEDGTGATIVQGGHTIHIGRGAWIERDPDTDRISETTSPLEP
jgi:hypothetical protein